MMLSHKILTRQDVSDTANYYEDSRDDYFAKDGEVNVWFGKGAKVLGLEGPVDRKTFENLLSGKISQSHQVNRATVRNDSKIRIGIDLTFSAPKSVTLQALIEGNTEILQAHDTAVKRTLAIAEGRAQVRQKIQGKVFVETTGNLVIATFRHETSREQDPQLHTHAVVMNMTLRSDGQWRALTNDEIIKATKYLGAVYRAELAHELFDLGFDLRFGRDGLFELAHISRDQLLAFSKRSVQVEDRLLQDGLDRESASMHQKQQATLLSRAPKAKVDRKTLFQRWITQAKELGISFEQDAVKREERDHSLANISKEELAKRSLRYAINHMTERQSIVTQQDLIDRSVKHGMGRIRYTDVLPQLDALTQSGYLIREIKGEDVRYTTQTAFEREKRILSIEKKSRGTVLSLLQTDRIAKRLEHSLLNQGQQDALSMILSTRNRVIGVQGFAGTGKSRMLSAVQHMLEEKGYTLQVFAPYAVQVKDLQASNILAKTLASFLKSKDRQLSGNDFVVLDEAGITPTRMMEQLLKLTEKAGARVLLLGDTAQTKAIEAGRPFAQLQANGMEMVSMTEIMRQRNKQLRYSVELAASGKTTQSLDHLKDIIELKDEQERLKHIAKDYLSLETKDRDKALVVTGTNDARKTLNGLIRDGLDLSGQGKVYTTLQRRDTTQAERRYARNYHIGDYIQPEKSYQNSGLKRGELYRIKDIGPGNFLHVENHIGQEIQFSPSSHRKLSVYQASQNKLAPGDKVRITRNDKHMDLANGDRFEVREIDDTSIRLSNGERDINLAANKPLHLDYAYATTIHGAQGLTADRVFIDANTKSFTTSKEVYYTAISRARDEARIYTDDRAALPDAIARAHEKSAALDLEQDHSSKQSQHSLDDYSK